MDGSQNYMLPLYKYSVSNTVTSECVIPKRKLEPVKSVSRPIGYLFM